MSTNMDMLSGAGSEKSVMGSELESRESTGTEPASQDALEADGELLEQSEYSWSDVEDDDLVVTYKCLNPGSSGIYVREK